MHAILNHSSTAYPVIKAWYHPGARRYLDQECFLSVRSTDWREGEIDPKCPDLAVLQLAPGGPDLPAEFPMATAAECADRALFAQRLAILGYPGHDHKRWPAPGDAVQATFHEGSVSRLTNFQLNSSVADADKQFLQYTIPDWNGFSGSPVYLANGHVVAVHNMARMEVSPAGEVRAIPHGVRIDCVWEMLRHHGLDQFVAIPSGITLNLERWLAKDDRDERCRKAVALVKAARRLIYTDQEYAEGVRKCDEALEVHKDYPGAWLVRSHGFNNYYFDNYRSLARADKLDLLGNALESAEKYAELAGERWPSSHLTVAMVLNNLANVSNNRNLNNLALARVAKVLARKGLSDHDYANALSTKAVALDGLGEDDDARELHLRAVRLAPDEPTYWEAFADYLVHNNGKKEFIDSNKARAKLLREQRQTLNAFWIRLLQTKDKLTTDDPAGKVRPKAFYKKHAVQMEQGLYYQIDTFSDDIDSFVRLEDPDGNTIADDDDSGGYLDAMIFHRAAKTGTYHVYVTTFHPQHVGSYFLRVQKGRK